jgi:hypothetical protein
MMSVVELVAGAGGGVTGLGMVTDNCNWVQNAALCFYRLHLQGFVVYHVVYHHPCMGNAIRLGIT